MAYKVRDRRVLKTDFVMKCDEDTIALIEQLTTEQQARIFRAALHIGAAAANAGYKKDSEEETEQAVEKAVEETKIAECLESFGQLQLENQVCKNLVSSIGESVKTTTTSYYLKSLANRSAGRSNAKSDKKSWITDEQQKEYESILKNPAMQKYSSEAQKSVIRNYCAAGFTWQQASTAAMMSGKSPNFDYIGYMKDATANDI